MLAENGAVLALLRGVFPICSLARDGAVLTVTLPLTEAWSWDAAALLGP
ncbi:hypothetical protein [Actinomycetospora cinnamomea]|uniref:Uncharacterized protein n=1 Tax=Actinomycetospora cinnamomea TaxID=663609 RepID=A0A2U1F8D5_9PSEU|nr:hypothetical protein [Actinomycetospora cinnamomea]PVZ08457.1 hypothetical protein C8D89_10850 [Actinomycetospora cinnamomea]